MNHGTKLATLAASVMVFGMLLPASPGAEEPAALQVPSQVETNPAFEQVRAFVQDIGDRAVAVVTAQPPATLSERHEALKGLIGEGFDLALIGRFVLGHHWRSASVAQRDEFQSLFATHLLNSYARQFSAYEGTTFTIISSQEVGEKDVLVETQIASADGPINAGWRVRPAEGQSRIIDVVIDGISMALTQRQEFGSLANREGIDGLLVKMRANAANQTAQLKDRKSPIEPSAKTRMLFSVVGSSGMPWEVSLSRR